MHRFVLINNNNEPKKRKCILPHPSHLTPLIMLRPPYTKYDRLYTYHLDLPFLPELKDPDLIGGWVEDKTAVFFFHKPKERLINKLCKKNDGSIIYQADLSYTDWESGQEISSFSVDDLTVAPVWDSTPAQVRLDPSVIFGSGFHPSTRLCLETLLKYATTPETPIRSLLDMGTGTGLLAIAAAKRGIERITAVDYNQLACEVAQKNAKRNKVDKFLTIEQVDLLKEIPETKGMDLVVANLYRGLLEKLFKNNDFWHARTYILAGFVPAMEADLLAALPTSGIRFLERRSKNCWCLWVLLRE